MPVSLSIKNAPDDMVRRLKVRAATNHRSLQGEIMAILEAAVEPGRSLTIRDILEQVRREGLRSPSDSVEIIRRDRDSR